MFFMKKHYRNIFDENVNLHEYVKKKRKKKQWKKICDELFLICKLKSTIFKKI